MMVEDSIPKKIDKRALAGIGCLLLVILLSVSGLVLHSINMFSSNEYVSVIDLIDEPVEVIDIDELVEEDLDQDENGEDNEDGTKDEDEDDNDSVVTTVATTKAHDVADGNVAGNIPETTSTTTSSTTTTTSTTTTAVPQDFEE